jgi:serine phosphatase RsbU (regulator of sigma subunit)
MEGATVTAGAAEAVPATADGPPGPERSGGRAIRPVWAGVVVGLVGLVITVAVAGVAWALNRRNEHRLLVVQTHQAAAVLGSTILSISDPLATGLQTARATDGDAGQFDRFMAGYTGPGRLFVSSTLFKADGGALTAVASVGTSPELTSPGIQALVTRALHSPTFVVTGIGASGPQQIGYAIADPKDPTFAVYAERAIPADRQVPVESNSAFADLDYATYLGSTRPADLATTDVAATELPLSGDTARAEIPFGDTTLILVAAPRGQLGGPLGAELPWIFLVGGVALTIGSAIATEELFRRRQRAEADAATIAALYTRLDGLYGEQRTIAETLQRALLPQSNPTIAELEIATRYVAGADGVDVGGDWYSLVPIDARHFAFVVGDVSGRGVSAATVMARMRFTLRAYLVEGHPPAAVLEMCTGQLDVAADGHFATALVGLGDVQTREVTLANAGHLVPLLISEGRVGFIPVPVGPPLGVAPGPYRSHSLVMAPGSALVAFTDGLVERRGEAIDTGLQRLADAATRPAPDLEGLLDTVVGALTGPGTEDDIAVLAFRWRDRPPGPATAGALPSAP